ncbi:allene oxide synthase-lipoxygenase protein-like, partial [Argonauta hians]
MGANQSTNELHVQTGDYKGSSTDSDVFVKLYDTEGRITDQILLDNTGKDDFQAGAIDIFETPLPEGFTEITKIELWTKRSVIEFTSSDWFLEIITFVPASKGKQIVFPVFRWIKPESKYFLYPWDTFLPQNDPDKKQRLDEIEHKRESYKMKYVEGLPVTCEELPTEEQFTAKYMWNIGTSKLDIMLTAMYERIMGGSWNELDDLTNVYQEEKLKKPESVKYWRDDKWFGNQRLNGCNPNLITLCEKIPPKLGVDEELLEPVLNGETLEDLIHQKRLFYTDLEILVDVPHRENLDVCAPIALFMLNSNDDLMPIAIQLQQEKGPNNPVFLPTDDQVVWTLAKMWYNLADSCYHQSLVHLGLTHLLMEGVVLAMHRNVSVSHPLYKILAPHTLFLLAINNRGFNKLVSPGGWVDKTMTIGIEGMFHLINKGIQQWDFSIDGVPSEEFAKRKVLSGENNNILPKYYFRDDSLAMYDCIYNYVSSYTDIYYETDMDVIEDWELQDWVECVSTDAKDGGIGIKGLPVKNGGKCQLTKKYEVKQFITSILFTCSVSHAHANFLQYEEYAFPANYPSMLRTPLITDKTPRTEEDIMSALPDKSTTLDVMAITQLLSAKTTNSLGDFETEYIYDPKAIPCVKQFRKRLQEISDNVRRRNETLEKGYCVLDPVNIPNAISI